MNDQEESRRWHTAVARAPFTIYGPSVPEPRALWAGGFGNSPTHIGVMADVDGVEVAVDTARPQRGLSAAVLQRSRIADAIWNHLLSDASEIDLPMRLAVAPEDRSVIVAGTATIFTGMRVVGSARWSGSAKVGDVLITVTTTDPAVVTAIESIDAAHLPELPPDAFAQ